MPFLDPTVEYDSNVREYRSALERFSQMVEENDLGGLPALKGHLGPIRSVQVSRASRDDGTDVVGQVRSHVINLLAGDPFWEPELRYNFNMLILMDVFGVPFDGCVHYEPELSSMLWDQITPDIPPDGE